MPNDSYNCSLKVQLQTTQRIATNAESSSSPQITHDNFLFEKIINSRSVNPVTLAIHHLYEDIDSTGIEIDLTNLPDINGGTKDASGKQLYAIYVVNKTAGSKILIKSAATNSYPVGSDSSTANVSSTVAATLVNTQDGIVGVQPEIFTLTIPTTANAGSLTLTAGAGHQPITIPYNAAATDVNWAVTWVTYGTTTVPSPYWSTTSPSSGVFVTTYASNSSSAIPSIATQGLLSITPSAVVTSIPVYDLHPTAILLGTVGVAVDSTHKRIKLATVSGTADAQVTLWFIDAVV